jgi:putative flippase GtrA
VPPSFSVTQLLTITSSLVSALLYPIPYILHPVVMMITFWGSVMVMVTNYVMVRRLLKRFRSLTND